MSLKILVRLVILFSMFFLISACTMIRWSQYYSRNKKLIANKQANQTLCIYLLRENNLYQFTAENTGSDNIYIKSYNSSYFTFFEKKVEEGRWISLGDISPGEIYKVTHTIAPKQTISLATSDKKVKALEKGIYRLKIYYYYGNMKQLYYSYSEPFSIQ